MEKTINYNVLQAEFKSKRAKIRAYYETEAFIKKAEYIASIQDLEKEKNDKMVELAKEEAEALQKYKEIIEKQKELTSSVVDK